MAGNDFDLIVVGAGIVGMSTALYAQKDGLRVALCDPNPPGSGTTAGSACTVATYACIPVNSPDIFTTLPRLLFSRDSPLSLNVAHALRNPRWMLSFLNNCRPSRVNHITQALGDILKHSDAGLDPLIEEVGAKDLIVRNDCLYVWSTPAGYEASRASTAARAAQGVSFDELTANEVRQLEPHLKLAIHRGLRFNGARHITSPQGFVTRMLKRFETLGGRYLPQAVTRSDPDANGVTVRLAEGSEIRAGRMALTAGAHSGKIDGTGGTGLPLGTERGYHVLYRDHGQQLSRPVGWAEAGFYATPMADGLRIAGTVEINAVDAPANPRRTDYLHRKAQQMFAGLPAPDDTWLGYRPTMPDSLPVIGPSPHSDRVILAFGHQHIGLTLGGITGRIVTDLAQGRRPDCDIEAFAPDRF